MRVLVGCERSGVVRRAFRALGHNAWSCDLLPPEDGSQFHYQEDVWAALKRGWDLFIVHPPCTRLAVSGALRLYRDGKKANGVDPAKRRERDKAIGFFMACVRSAASVPNQPHQSPACLQVR